eukprot:6488610-Ditylum_brightwellii.AAC.1
MSALDKGKQWKAALALLSAMEKATAHYGIGALEENKNEKDDEGGQLGGVNREAKAFKNEESWSFPPPNVYTYASAISSCARCHKVEEAFSILDRMGGDSNSGDNNSDIASDAPLALATATVLPNTWVYNAAMTACVGGSSSSSLNNRGKSQVGWTRNNYQNRLDTVLALLDRMEEDARLRG